MIKHLSKRIIILLFFFLSVFPATAMKNDIIVKINNNIVTAYELKNKLKTSLILSGQKINQENINKKIGRNEPCLCGSGKKYKRCCGAL